MKTNHLTDEQLIDWVEGEIDDDTFIWSHLNQCEECYHNYRNWKKLLQSGESLNEVDRKSIWKRIQEQKQADEYQKNKRKKYLVSAGWIASCFIFLVVGYVLGQGQPSNYVSTTVNEDQLDTFMNEPVRHYDMIHSEGGERQGVAWYNPLNRQMILYLDDPRYLDGETKDVHIETAERVIQVQPNHLQDGKMQFYLRDRELQGIMQLIVGHDDHEQTYNFQVMTKNVD